jgi:hypothetical protein
MDRPGVAYRHVSTESQSDRGVSLEPQAGKIRPVATVQDSELISARRSH